MSQTVGSAHQKQQSITFYQPEIQAHQINESNLAKPQITTAALGETLTSFAPFPRLPPEVKDMIWEIVLTSPQVHILRDWRWPFKSLRSSQNLRDAIIMSCKGAFLTAERLKFDYYVSHNVSDRPRKEYINRQEDVFCLINAERGGMRGTIPGRICWFVNGVEIDRDFPSKNYSKVQIRRIAVPLVMWENPHYMRTNNFSHSMGTVEVLVHQRVEELLIVLQSLNTGDVGWELVEPTRECSPKKYGKVMDSEGDTWDALEQDVMKKFQEFKDAAVTARNEHFALHGNYKFTLGSKIPILCDWKIPTVKFVTRRGTTGARTVKATDAKKVQELAV